MAGVVTNDVIDAKRPELNLAFDFRAHVNQPSFITNPCRQSNQLNPTIQEMNWKPFDVLDKTGSTGVYYRLYRLLYKCILTVSG